MPLCLTDESKQDPFNHNIDQAVDTVLGGYVWKIMYFTKGICKPLLKKIYHTLEACLSWHSKIFVIRFDISLQDSPPNNNVIGKLMGNITKQLKTYYNSMAVFGWVREQNGTDNKCHYHCFVILNGHKADSTNTTFAIVKHAMRLVIDVTFYFPENSGYTVKRHDLASFQAVLYRLSYLAKNQTKQQNPPLVKSYNFSRIHTKTAIK